VAWTQITRGAIRSSDGAAKGKPPAGHTEAFGREPSLHWDISAGPLTHTVGTNGVSDQGAAMKNHDPRQIEALSPMAHGPSLPASDRRGRCPLKPICRRGSTPPPCCGIVVFDMRSWLPEEALKGFRKAWQLERGARIGTQFPAAALVSAASARVVSVEHSMFRRVFPLSALLIASVSIVSAAGGGAAGGAGGAAGGGAHGSSGHGGSSFGKPAVVTARPGCLGAVAGVPFAGAPWPTPSPSKTNPSPTNGLAVEGTVQSNLPRLTPQDQRILAAIKQANEKLGTSVMGTTDGQVKNRQPSRPANVTSTNEGIQRRNNGPFRPLIPLAQSDSSAVKKTTDPRSVQGQPDVSHMSEESQRLAREIIRETDKLGKVGNSGSGDGRSQAQQESLTGPSDTNNPHRPTSTVGATSRSC
jgi:hypothetical protein